jgi:two-component system, LytTR family, sensor kinase
MMVPMEQESRAWWLGNASIWAGIGLLDATQNVFVMRAEGMHHNWAALFLMLLISWLPWALATPVILRLGRTYVLKPGPGVAWLRHGAAWALIALISAGWVAELESILNPWATSPEPPPFVDLWISRFENGLLQSLFLYAAVVAFGAVIESRNRLLRREAEAARLSEQLAQAQLTALRHQIEPHFLFNALNAVACLVREERKDAAIRTIAGLSDCLRHVLADSGRQFAPLSEEVAFLERYLNIQKVRLADALRFSIELPPDLMPIEIPRLVLQPLVENAIKHGIAKRVEGGAIRISGSRSENTVTVNVYNDGPLLPLDWTLANSGIGLSNILKRLRSLYGSAFVFDIRNCRVDGVLASVSIPVQTA